MNMLSLILINILPIGDLLVDQFECQVIDGPVPVQCDGRTVCEAPLAFQVLESGTVEVWCDELLHRSSFEFGDPFRANRDD